VNPLLFETAARVLLAPILIIAAAVLVKGYTQVGDGFAAGTIAALGVLLQLVAAGPAAARPVVRLENTPRIAAAGLALALAVGAFPLLRGEPPYSHLPEPGAEVVRVGTLELITAVAFDVGVACLVFGALVGIVGYLAHARSEAEGER
jgi:multisubunit Na+/H+ antiporter MnhB subunit